jgi:hypothetical protein
LLRPDLNVLRNSLSYYAIGPWGALQTLAFLALGVTSVALAIALPSGCSRSSSLLACVWLLVFAGVASFGLALYPMAGEGPSTLLGDAHQTAGTIGGVAELAATLAFITACRANPIWNGLVRAAKLTFALSLIGAILAQLAIWWPELGIPMGAAMRLFVIPLLVFWGAVAWRLSRRN